MDESVVDMIANRGATDRKVRTSDELQAAILLSCLAVSSNPQSRLVLAASRFEELGALPQDSSAGQGGGCERTEVGSASLGELSGWFPLFQTASRVDRA